MGGAPTTSYKNLMSWSLTTRLMVGAKSGSKCVPHTGQARDGTSRRGMLQMHAGAPSSWACMLFNLCCCHRQLSCQSDWWMLKNLKQQAWLRAMLQCQPTLQPPPRSSSESVPPVSTATPAILRTTITNSGN